MSFLGNTIGSNSKPVLKTSNIQTYHPGEFLKRFGEQKESTLSYLPPRVAPQHTVFKESFIGGLNSYTDDFYKSQVMERAIGGEPVMLRTMDNYQPLSADDPHVMDQIRQEHLKIMDQKLQEAITVNGGNAMQQVKTIIVEPLAEVIQVKQSNVTQGFYGVARKSGISTTAMLPSLPSGHVSNVSIGAPPTIPSGKVQRKASQVNGVIPTQQGGSRIQYVPFQRKVVQYETVQRIQRIPRQRVVIEYEEKKIVEQVPVEKTVVDYCVVQHITQYEPKVIEETIIEMVPVQKTYHTTSYVPIEQQIIHMPGQNGQGGQSRIIYQGPPTAQGTAALKSQSRITYQQPLMKSNSVLSYENPQSLVNGPSIETQRRKSRTPPKVSPSKPSSSSLLKRQPSPITLRPKQSKKCPQSVTNVGNQGYEYQQQQFYMHDSSPILPFTNQLQQAHLLQSSPFSQYNTVQYIQPTSYPSPSQVQTIYQIPGSQNVGHGQFNQTYTNVNKPNYGNSSGSRFVPIQQSMPHEVVQQEKKIMRRQSSGLGISLTR